MDIKDKIDNLNKSQLKGFEDKIDFCLSELTNRGCDINSILDKLSSFSVAIPSWALGAGGTRFGRFTGQGEPSTLEQKIEDVSIINQLTGCAKSISLHIPWDIPKDHQAIRQYAASKGVYFDAVNSNTFQDQVNQEFSYKYGSLSHIDQRVRNQAIEHNIEVIRHGEALGSKELTVWLSDGSNFPGQVDMRLALRNTQDSLQKIYASLPSDWRMLIEYKPYEPNFYHTVIQDWGTSFLLATACGERAATLVDLGHHLPNTNIEYVVSILLENDRLGGFHFNDSKYGDDDLTVGCIKPYQLFLIFTELVSGMYGENKISRPISWMIDASHNIKDPIEDLIQSLEAIMIAYAQALIIDRKALDEARLNNDTTMAQEVLQDAYRTDVRPLIAYMRKQKMAALSPIIQYRDLEIRNKLIEKRGKDSKATGL